MTITALQVEQHLESSGLAPVYVLCGDDASLMSNVLLALRRKNEAEDMPGSMAVEFDTVEDTRRIFDELYTQPFLGMSGRRMVVVRAGADLAASASEQLTDYAQRPSPSSVLVLCCEKLDRRKNPGRKLSECAVWIDCSRIRWNDARQWLRSQVRRHGKTMDSDTEYALMEAIGPDIATLQNELDKLVLYTGESKAIDRRAIDAIVPASRSRTVFELSDMIAGSDPAGAMALGQNLLLYGEAPEMIIAFLGVRMRDLWRMARLARRRLPAHDIARRLSLPEFVVKKALGAVKRRDDRWFAGRLRILAEADVELKTSSLPARQRTVWLTGIIARLCGTS